MIYNQMKKVVWKMEKYIHLYVYGELNTKKESER
jgi:hypothetical protein